MRMRWPGKRPSPLSRQLFAGLVGQRIFPSSRQWVILLTVGTLLYLILGPLFVLAYSSLKLTKGTLPFSPAASWSVANYQELFLSPETYRVLWNTLVYCSGTIALSFAISLILVWLIERTDLPFRTLSLVLIVAQLGIPTIILSISWALLLSPGAGYVNRLLRSAFGLQGEGPFDVFSMGGMIFVEAVSVVPITVLLLGGAFRAMNVSLEEAAAASGAPFSTVFRRITLPVLLPGVLSALVYQFVTVLETLDVPLIIGLRGDVTVISTLIYLKAQGAAGLPDYGITSAYSVLTLILALAPLLYYNRIIARSERFGTVTGKAYYQRRYSLGAGKPLAIAFVFGFLLVGFMLPVGALIWTSLQPYVRAPSFAALRNITLESYRALPTNPAVLEGIWNTLLLGVVTGIVTMVLGLLTAWIIVRVRSGWSRLVDVIAFLPHAFPGVIIGISILLIYSVVPLPIYGTLWIIVLALSTQYISLSSRLMGGAVAQIGKELEDAGEASGARWLQIFRRILLPLLFLPMVNGMLLVFLSSIKNLTLPLLLYSPDSVVLSTLVWVRWQTGSIPEAATIGVVMVLMTLVLTVSLRGVGGSAVDSRRGGGMIK